VATGPRFCSPALFGTLWPFGIGQSYHGIFLVSLRSCRAELQLLSSSTSTMWTSIETSATLSSDETPEVCFTCAPAKTGAWNFARLGLLTEK